MSGNFCEFCVADLLVEMRVIIFAGGSIDCIELIRRGNLHFAWSLVAATFTLYPSSRAQ
jgi:hypothetical protein